MKFKKFHTVVLERRSQAGVKSRSIWIHATDAKNLRSILKHGLQANSKKLVWGDKGDEMADFFNPSDKSYGGVYLSNRMNTALGIGKDFHDFLLIFVEIQPRTLVLDEDDIVGTLSGLHGEGSDDFSKNLLYWAHAVQNNKITPGIQGKINDYINKFIRNNSRDIIMSQQFYERLRPMLIDCWKSEVLRKLAYIHKQWFGYDNETEKETVLQYAKEHNLKVSIPNASRAERDFRSSVDKLIQTIRNKAFKKYEKGIQTSRSLSDIGFRGTNRIICIVQCDREKEDGVMSNFKAKVVYGKITPEIQDIFKASTVANKYILNHDELL